MDTKATILKTNKCKSVMSSLLEVITKEGIRQAYPKKGIKTEITTPIVLSVIESNFLFLKLILSM